MSNYHLRCPHVSFHWSANYLSRNLAATLLANYSSPSLNTSFWAPELNNMKYSQAAASCERGEERSVTMLQRIKNCQEIQWVLRFANDCRGSTTHYHQHTPSLRLIAGSPVSSLQIFTLLFFWTPQMFFCRRSSFKPFGKRLCSKNG